MIYYDSESCGLHGMPVLMQWAEDSGPIQLYEPWVNPIWETLEFIEWLCTKNVCGFNLAFDWFLICKIYTTFSLFPDKSVIPEYHIDELAFLEEEARFSNVCLKPKSALDLMLFARKGPYQSLMDRDDIRIRRVPNQLAFKLAKHLDETVHFDEIYFAKQKDKRVRWKVLDIINKFDNTVNPNFKDIKLTFRASGALKSLAIHALKIPREEVITFGQIEVDKKWWPKELGYAPYALAIAPDYRDTLDWKHAWPECIPEHILHWGYHQEGRKYASDDVKYTRMLHPHFEKMVGHTIEPGDDDSELACMVAASRWHGYAIDIPLIERLRDEAYQRVSEVPQAPAQVRAYLSEKMDSIEQLVIQDSTKKQILIEIAAWTDDDDPMIPHPAAVRAKEVLEARKSKKEIEVYDKLLLARRFHADFKVIGALSSRMSGNSGLNAQGINHEKSVRAAFPLADSSIEILAMALKLSVEAVVNRINEEALQITKLCGGDFKSFEVSLAAKVFNDPDIDAILDSGKKIHAEIGQLFFPGMTYDQILATDGTKEDKYDASKKGIFAIFYGGEGYTLHTRLGIPREIGDVAYQQLINRFRGIGRTAKEVADKFSSLRQPGGIGSRIDYQTPVDFEESFLGFKRYFTLENTIIKALYDLAQNIPESFKRLPIRVQRRDRVQTAGGATQSALFGCAFGMQQSIIRAAKNHKIQSPGANITKGVQRVIWDIQPAGINKWIVQPMNIHDEVMCPTASGYEQVVEEKVQAKVAEYRKVVPRLAIDWFTNIPNWATKKGVPIAA